MPDVSTVSRTPSHELNMRVIHLLWEGPTSLKELVENDKEPPSKKVDKGLYQVYGSHPVYGPKVLLYIGMTCETFAQRLREHYAEWRNIGVPDYLTLDVYLGRLMRQSKDHTPTDWSDQIKRIEKLLIFAHAPAWNSSSINTGPDQEIKNLHVLNWGQRGSLLPELTGAYWSSRYDTDDYWPYYGEPLPK